MSSPIGFADLLDALSFEDTEHITVNYQVPGGEFTTRITTPDRAPALIAEVSGSANVWWGINPIVANPAPDPRTGRSGRGRVADVTRWSCLHADIDIKPGGVPSWPAAREVIEDLSAMIGTRPVAVVMTGNGLQPYWALDPEDEGTDLRGEDNRHRAVALLRRWGRLVQRVADTHGGRVDSVYDLPRVLRVPGR